MPNKYGAKRTVCRAQHNHDSKRESERCDELHLLASGGAILDLSVHPRYHFVVNGVNIGSYEADFKYEDAVTGVQIVEDVKGVKTAVYQLKKKLMLALYGIKITET